MRLNDDNETVAAVDFLVPQAGELMGGSQREERYDILKNRMDELKMDEEELDWYLRLRQYGGVKHSGFGLGFEKTTHLSNRNGKYKRCNTIPKNSRKL